MLVQLLGIIRTTETTSGWLEAGGGSFIVTLRKVWGGEDPTLAAKLLMEFVMAVDEAQAPVAKLGVSHLLPAVVRYQIRTLISESVQPEPHTKTYSGRSAAVCGSSGA